MSDKQLTARPVTPELAALMDDLKQTLQRHEHLSGVEFLCVVAQLLGNLSALMDQRVYSSQMVNELMVRNIQIGNDAVCVEVASASMDVPH